MAALFLIGAGLGGCGGSDGANPPAGNSGVSASQDLAPLTVAQIRRVPQTDPFSAVVRLWFWAQWGSAPNLVGAYDPTVVRVAGPANLASVYAAQRATFLSYRPRLIARIQSGSRAFVAVEGRGPGVNPLPIGFDLRRVGTRWLITHDTFVENLLADTVTARADPDPLRTKHPAVYVKRGETVADRFRALFPAPARQRVPASAVLRFWYWIHWGSTPNIVGAYDPTVVRLLGATDIALAYAKQRPTLMLYKLTVTSNARRGNRAFVGVEGRGPNVKPLRIGFDLRRIATGWVITHDSYLEGLITDVVAARADPNPLRTSHPRAYIKRGQILTDRFRTLFPSFGPQLTPRSGSR